MSRRKVVPLRPASQIGAAPLLFDTDDGTTEDEALEKKAEEIFQSHQH